MFKRLKNVYFQLEFLYKSDLRISTAGKHIGIIKNKLNCPDHQQSFLKLYTTVKLPCT